MVMPADMPAGTSMDEPDRLQLDIGYPGRDVQSGLALHADGLQLPARSPRPSRPVGAFTPRKIWSGR
jgi:hypothetical protein